MVRVPRNKVIYKFDKNNAPVLTVFSGEQVMFETQDCFSGQLLTIEGTKNAKIDWAHINPATGPLAIQGAEPGDMIEVEIQRIVLSDQGIIATAPGWGPLGNRVNRLVVKKVQIRNNMVFFDRDITLPVSPMVGVIGTAPAEHDIPCTIPGAHGGNMDVKVIQEGSRVFLPVFVPGGLIALGDVHALMADGEVCGTAVECSADVYTTIKLHKNVKFFWPIVVKNNKECFVIIVAETLDRAIEIAIETFTTLCQEVYHYSWYKAYMLASITADIELCQLVNPAISVRLHLKPEIVGGIFPFVNVNG